MLREVEWWIGEEVVDVVLVVGTSSVVWYVLRSLSLFSLSALLSFGFKIGVGEFPPFGGDYLGRRGRFN